VVEVQIKDVEREIEERSREKGWEGPAKPLPKNILNHESFIQKL